MDWTAFLVGFVAFLAIGFFMSVLYDRCQRAKFAVRLSPAERERLEGFEKGDWRAFRKLLS